MKYNTKLSSDRGASINILRKNEREKTVAPGLEPEYQITGYEQY